MGPEGSIAAANPHTINEGLRINQLGDPSAQAIVDFGQEYYRMPDRFRRHGQPGSAPPGVEHESDGVYQITMGQTDRTKSVAETSSTNSAAEPLAELNGLNAVYTFLENNFSLFDKNGNGRVYLNDIRDTKLANTKDQEISKLLQTDGSTWNTFLASSNGMRWGKTYLTLDDLRQFRQNMSEYEDRRRHQKEAVPDLYEEVNYLAANWSKLGNSVGMVTHGTINAALESTRDPHERSVLEKLNRTLDQMWIDHADAPPAFSRSPVAPPVDVLLGAAIPHFAAYSKFEDYLDTKYEQTLPREAAVTDEKLANGYERISYHDQWVRSRLHIH